ncbi:hypothetical protein E3J62_00585 [candidate division TA06 bacterium]|uniref:Uncharacterized protein n=1 Tax=candidate division TA06 bacterium TaxID=2250710 RepID=A0A523UYW8_UNCT6|nr:MAG: hypothetical protein E3J62_00585 [candidate division TA06 bacterium]
MKSVVILCNLVVTEFFSFSALVMKRLFLSLLLPAIVSLLMGNPAVSQEVSIGNRRTFPWISHESKTYFGMQTGLLVYDHLSDVWNATYVGEDAASNRINVLGMDEDILWVGTNGGVANSDVRLGDWITYDMEGGLPSDTVLSLGFEEDYAWVGTPDGVARFDKLTEEWDVYDTTNGLSSNMVNDIIVRTGRLWLCTDKGVSEYDTEYEVWRVHVDEAPALGGPIERVHASKGVLWFFGERGVCRYDENTRFWSEYSKDRWKPESVPDQIVAEGDSLWLVASGKIFLFDPSVDVVSEFEYSSDLGKKEVRYMSVTSSEIRVATDKDVASFRRGSKIWKFYGPAQGLASQDFLTTVKSFNFDFACGGDGSISYQKWGEGKWYEREPLKPIEEEVSARLKLTSDERGTGVILPHDNSLLLKGSTTWNFERSMCNWFDPEGRSDLTLSGSITGERSLSGRYDDTDFEKTVYGLTFRGAQKDLLRKVSFGHGRSEFGRDKLVRSLDIFGVFAEVGYGEKTGRAKRLGLSATTGERRSGFDSDFFVGIRKGFDSSIDDVDYVERRYFLIDTAGMWLPVVHGSDEVFLDDRYSGNNNANTFLDTMIGGIVGDFDRLYPVLDYALDNINGILDFRYPVDSLHVLAVSLRSSVGKREIIVQSDSVRGFAQVNRYSLPRSMIPTSVSMSIVDTSGVVHPLSEFGLDEDMDGRVDPEYVDFKNGLLVFPERRPFPEEVYTSDVHIYTIHIQHETFLPTYGLSHRRIVRPSETVRLDGAFLERGNDYILDYTSGTLIILKDELIGDRTQVDVTYEYERDSDEQLNMVEVKVNPNDAFRGVIRGIRFDDDEMSLEASDMVHGSMEIRTRTLGMDFRVPVELAKGVDDSLDGIGQKYSVYASGKSLRANASYESYGDDFVSFAPERGRLGMVKDAYGVAAQYDFFDWLVGGVDWGRQAFRPDSGEFEPVWTNALASFIFSKPRLPAFGLKMATNTTALDSIDERMRQVGSEISYNISEEELPGLPVKSLNLSSSFVRTWWDETPGDSSGIYDGGSFMLLSTLFRGVSVGAEYLHRFGKQDSVGRTTSYQTSGSGEVRLSGNIDRIPGLSFYGKTERETKEDPYTGASGRRDGDYDWRDYARIGVYPGVWYGRLSLIDFEYEISKHLSAHLRDASGPLSIRHRFLEAPNDLLDNRYESKTEDFDGRIRPHVTLLLDFSYQKTREMSRVLDSFNGTERDRYEGKAEYIPRYRSTFTLQHGQTRDRYSPLSSRIDYSSSAWWEERWTYWVFTKTGFSHWYAKNWEGSIGSAQSSLNPQLSATFRAKKFPLLGNVELSSDLGLRRSTNDSSVTMQYAGGFQLDIKPIHLLRLKTKLDLGYVDGLSTNLVITVTGTF